MTARPLGGARVWTQEEDDLIRSAIAEGLTRAQALRRFKDPPSKFDDRNISALYNRARALGLKFCDLAPRPWHFPDYIGWTDARTELAKRLWRAGSTAMAIATELGHGMTKNAVIGKMTRLGWHKPKAAVKRALRQPRKRLKAKPGKVAAVSYWGSRDWKTPPRGPTFPLPHIVDVARVSHANLKRRHCRWVVGDVSEAIAHAKPLYCGLPRLPCSPYCAQHDARAHRGKEVTLTTNMN